MQICTPALAMQNNEVRVFEAGFRGRVNRSQFEIDLRMVRIKARQPRREPSNSERRHHVQAKTRAARHFRNLARGSLNAVELFGGQRQFPASLGELKSASISMEKLHAQPGF
jgi:hypothetical protein